MKSLQSVYLYAFVLALILCLHSEYWVSSQSCDTWSYFTLVDSGTNYSSCNYSNLEGVRILPGVVSERKFGQHSYLGALVLPSVNPVVCEIVLIDQLWGLVAAHCAVKLQAKLNDTFVQFGDDSSEKVIINGTQVYPAYIGLDRILPHPEFDKSTRKNDIALVRFKKPVTYSKYLSAVCLLVGNNTPSDSFYESQSVLFVGIRNYTREKVTWKDKLINTIGTSQCRKEINDAFNEEIDSRVICLENERRECFGEESGIALLVMNSVVYLGGILSRAFECGLHEKIYLYPAIFTKTASYMEFIRNTTVV
ncbi:venom protease-like [Planococcus citri]|uniref:venom protease-like n=1 Tax=Planococcus citri TaxID=170843 RepID=UPI0031F8D5C0